MTREQIEQMAIEYDRNLKSHPMSAGELRKNLVEFAMQVVKNCSIPDDTPKCVLSIVSHRTFSSSEHKNVRIEAVYDGSGTAVSTYRVVDGNRNIWFQGSRKDCERYLYGG